MNRNDARYALLVVRIIQVALFLFFLRVLFLVFFFFFGARLFFFILVVIVVVRNLDQMDGMRLRHLEFGIALGTAHNLAIRMS